MVKKINLFGETEKPKEAEVLRELQQYLAARCVFSWRNNSGSYSDKDSGRYIRFGKKGSSDILAIFPADGLGRGKGKLWLIEAKRPGGLLSDAQLEFLSDARKAGAVVTVAESSYDLETQLADMTAPCSDRYEKAFQKWTERRV